MKRSPGRDRAEKSTQSCNSSKEGIFGDMQADLRLSWKAFRSLMMAGSDDSTKLLGGNMQQYNKLLCGNHFAYTCDVPWNTKFGHSCHPPQGQIDRFTLAGRVIRT
jgi:hypothetical protein